MRASFSGPKEFFSLPGIPVIVAGASRRANVAKEIKSTGVFRVTGIPIPAPFGLRNLQHILDCPTRIFLAEFKSFHS